MKSDHSETKIRTKLITGMVMTALFIGGFGGMVAFAPVSKGTEAPGTIRTDDNRNKVVHPEGGKVRSIWVEEGVKVEAGQLLLALDDTKAKAALQAIIAQLLPLQCREIRLRAERDRLDVMPEEMPELANTVPPDQLRILVAQETKVFVTRKRKLEAQEADLRQKIAGAQAEHQRLVVSLQQRSTQQQVVEGLLEKARLLSEKGLKPRPEYMQMQRRAAEIDGEIAHHKSLITSTDRNRIELKMRLHNLGTERQSEVVQEMKKVKLLISDYQESLAKARDIVFRTNISAPFKGTVVTLGVNMIGTTVAPGDMLVEIVPAGKSLVVEARIEPTDIASVYPGLVTQIRLSDFNKRRTPVMKGVVRHVSSETKSDPRTGKIYYPARVDITDAQALPPGVHLEPGMAADLLILRRKQTTLEYMVAKIHGAVPFLGR